MTIALPKRAARHAVRHCHRFFKDPNVLLIGIGYKHKKGRRTGRISIVFGVRRKIKSLGSIPIGYRIPKKIKFPTSKSFPSFTIETDVVVRQPKYFAGSSVAGPGSAIQPQDSQSYGTLGGLVQDQNGKRYLISCSHVLTDYGRCDAPNQPILLCASQQIIAQLSRYFAVQPGFENYADVALAEVCDPALVVEQPPISGISGIASAIQQSNVTIVGASSPIGRGSVINPLVTVSETVFGWSGNDASSCLFTDQIELSSIGKLGDSGSIVRDSQNRAIGIYVAHSQDFDLATPIKTALSFAGAATSMICSEQNPQNLTLAFI